MTERRLTYKSRVVGSQNQVAGLMGLIVFDEQASRFVAISSAYVVAGQCSFLDGGDPIGYALRLVRERRGPGTLAQPSSSLLAPVLLNDKILLGDGELSFSDGAAYPTLDVDPHDHIGQKVLAHLPDREPVDALLVSSVAKFAMVPEVGSEPVFFEDALELFFVGEMERARRSDAGAIVTTPDGGVLGIVVSASGEKTYAAPLKPILHQLRGCVPLGNSIIEAQNVRATMPEADPKGDRSPQQEPSEAAADHLARDWYLAWKSQDKRAMLDAAGRIKEACLHD